MEKIAKYAETPVELVERNNQEYLKDYEIIIRFLSRGCIIEVGCKSIPFESVETAIKELSDYVNNPYEVGEKWRKLLK